MRATWLLLGLVPTAAQAHVLGRSLSDVKPLDGGVSVVFAFDPDDLEPGLGKRFDDDGSGMLEARELATHDRGLAGIALAGYVANRGGERCEGEVRRLSVSEEATMLEVHWLFSCPRDGPLTIEVPLLEQLRDGHAHLLTVRLPQGLTGAALTRDEPSWHEGGQLWREAGRFLRLGLVHIALGYDHLLFLVGLLLVTTRLRHLVLIVTSFTVAHSLTLMAAALGTLAVSSALVEPLIALSIAYVGAENLAIVRRGAELQRYRPLLTFALGLVHGLGFAGVLAETGLPERGRVLSLLAFNLGVEAGQLVVVLLLAPLLLWLARRPAWTKVQTLGSAAVLVLGLAWFVARLLG